MISEYVAQLAAQLAAQLVAHGAGSVPPARIGQLSLGATDFEWTRHCVISYFEIRPYVIVHFDIGGLVAV